MVYKEFEFVIQSYEALKTMPESRNYDGKERQEWYNLVCTLSDSQAFINYETDLSNKLKQTHGLKSVCV